MKVLFIRGNQNERLRVEVITEKKILDLDSLSLEEVQQLLKIKPLDNGRLPTDWREVNCDSWTEVAVLLNDLGKDTSVMNYIYGYEVMNEPYEPISVYYTTRHSFS